MMKNPLNARSVRTTLIAVAAVSAMTLPLVASASASNVKITYDKTELESAEGQERLYEQLKTASRDICKLPHNNVIGPLTKPTLNAECYVGTLTAAVQRLDNTAITALHNQ